MKEIEIWNFIERKLAADIPVVLMVVAESNNSSPGRAGFKMVVARDEEMTGTIGGGIMEYNLIKTARNLFTENDRTIMKELHHDPHQALDKSGLICGGSQTVILRKLDRKSLPLCHEIINKYDSRQNGVLRITADHITLENAKDDLPDIHFKSLPDSEWIYEEPYGVPDTVYIIGGGHVGLAVARVLANLNFYIITIDPRKEVFTLKQNTYAHRIIHVPYDEAGKFIRDGHRSYVVIVTHAFTSDRTFLRSVIHKKVRYIGMMGSRVKIKKIIDELIEDGMAPALFEPLHAPIGLKIGAETPEEIAVSIASEIIQARHSDYL